MEPWTIRASSAVEFSRADVRSDRACLSAGGTISNTVLSTLELGYKKRQAQGGKNAVYFTWYTVVPPGVRHSASEPGQKLGCTQGTHWESLSLPKSSSASYANQPLCQNKTFSPVEHGLVTLQKNTW